MKTTRIICIVFAWLCMISIAGISKLDFQDIAYTVGIFTGYIIFLIPSFILFFIAKKIRKKLNRKKQEALINSFENI